MINQMSNALTALKLMIIIISISILKYGKKLAI